MTPVTLLGAILGVWLLLIAGLWLAGYLVGYSERRDRGLRFEANVMEMEHESAERFGVPCRHVSGKRCYRCR